jgi:hypothetical protein
MKKQIITDQEQESEVADFIFKRWQVVAACIALVSFLTGLSISVARLTAEIDAKADKNNLNAVQLAVQAKVDKDLVTQQYEDLKQTVNTGFNHVSTAIDGINKRLDNITR